jgi:hypothetical protein
MVAAALGLGLGAVGGRRLAGRALAGGAGVAGARVATDRGVALARRWNIFERLPPFAAGGGLALGTAGG